MHALIPLEDGTSYYEAGKLAFNLLPIVLSRIKVLGGSQVHEAMVFLRTYQPLI